jgi:hypothetical protein
LIASDEPPTDSSWLSLSLSLVNESLPLAQSHPVSNREVSLDGWDEMGVKMTFLLRKTDRRTGRKIRRIAGNRNRINNFYIYNLDAEFTSQNAGIIFACLKRSKTVHQAPFVSVSSVALPHAAWTLVISR